MYKLPARTKVAFLLSILIFIKEYNVWRTVRKMCRLILGQKGSKSRPKFVYTNLGLDNSGYHAKTESNNYFIMHISEHSM